MESSSSFEIPILEYGETLGPPTPFEFAGTVHRYLYGINQLENLTINKVHGKESTVAIPCKVWESIHDSLLRFSVAKTSPIKSIISSWEKRIVVKNDAAIVTEQTAQKLASTLRHLIRGHVYCSKPETFKNLTDADLLKELVDGAEKMEKGARMIFDTIIFLAREFEAMTTSIKVLQRDLEEAKNKPERVTKMRVSVQPSMTKTDILAAKTARDTEMLKLRNERNAALTQLQTANAPVAQSSVLTTQSSSQHQECDKIIQSARTRYTRAVETHQKEIEKKDNELRDLRSHLANLRKTGTGMDKRPSVDQRKAGKNDVFMKGQIASYQNENAELQDQIAALKIEMDELRLFKDNNDVPHRNEGDILRKQVEDLQVSLNSAQEKARGDEAAKKLEIEIAVRDGSKSLKEHLKRKKDKIQELRDGILDLDTAMKKAYEANVTASERMKDLRDIAGKKGNDA